MSLGPEWGAAGEVAGADEVVPAELETSHTVPQPPRTGDAEVDNATAEVAAWAAARGTLEEQLAGYEAAHRILQARLADVEG